MKVGQCTKVRFGRVRKMGNGDFAWHFDPLHNRYPTQPTWTGSYDTEFEAIEGLNKYTSEIVDAVLGDQTHE